MNFLDKMERKYGRYALSHLTMYIIVTYIAGYIIALAAPIMRQYLTLEPYYILHGQIWRLVSWILIPPSSLDIFTIIMLFFYYSIGTSLERAWGDFKYNVYIFSGILMTILGSFLLYGIEYAVNGYPALMGTAFSTYYISLSIFLGFAISFPDMQVLLYFIIPIKIKWLAMLDGLYFVYAIVQAFLPAYGGGDYGIYYKANALAAFISILNFIIFFLSSRNMKPYSPGQMKRKNDFKRKMRQAERPVNVYANGAKHRCAVCGRTEMDDPNLEFRYCSKCNGNYEYCQDHLFTHTHVK